MAPRQSSSPLHPLPMLAQAGDRLSAGDAVARVGVADAGPVDRSRR